MQAVLHFIKRSGALPSLHFKIDPRAMPLDKFLAETMSLLATGADEISVENVKFLRNAASTGNDAAFFKKFNDAMSQIPH